MPTRNDSGEPIRREVRHGPHEKPRGPHKRDRATRVKQPVEPLPPPPLSVEPMERAVVVRCLHRGSALLTPNEADAAADQLRAAANAARLYGTGDKP